MTGYAQLLTHLVGDYWLQSDWMAVNKTKRTIPCLIHILIYTLVFAVVGYFSGGISLIQLAIIGGSHFLIDRFALPKYLIWGKNKILSPPGSCRPWRDCNATGFDPARPLFVSVWLLIICDNILHLLINFFALSM